MEHEVLMGDISASDCAQVKFELQALGSPSPESSGRQQARSTRSGATPARFSATQPCFHFFRRRRLAVTLSLASSASLRSPTLLYPVFQPIPHPSEPKLPGAYQHTVE